TRFPGFAIAAVSAMKCTPQMTSTGASSSVARRHAERIGDDVCHVLDLGPLVIVRQDGGPSLRLEVLDFRDQVRRIGLIGVSRVTRTTLPLVEVPPLRGRLGNASVHRSWWTAPSGGRDRRAPSEDYTGGIPCATPPWCTREPAGAVEPSAPCYPS